MREHKITGGGGGGWGRLKAQLCAALAEHLATGKPPRLPVAGVPIWQAFATLSARRLYDRGLPQALSLAEIAELGRLWRFPFERRHVDLICALDTDWRRLQDAPKVAGTLTPELFDAMFG